MTVQGKIALVTGGSRGIGRAIVLRLAQQGATVAFCDILTKEARDVVGEVEKLGSGCTFIKADITSIQDIKRMVRKVEEKYNGIDILVNNAGWSKAEAFEAADEIEWRSMIDINLWGPLVVTKAVVGGMIQRRSGNIVNVGSDSARIGFASQVVYSACKGAIISATKSLARELARYNIRVNCVSPGTIITPLIEEEKSRDPNYADKFVRPNPMRRLGKPEEVAAAVLFLASSESSYITGGTISVSGGATMI